mgnify:CR=1 FL=1
MKFPHSLSPPDEFVRQANVTDPDIYAEFEDEWPECWERAADFVDWADPYDAIVEPVDDPPYYQWFVDGSLNASYNCLDRHVADGRGEEAALTWISEAGAKTTYSYRELLDEVTEVAALLEGLGVEAGDRVAMYLPRIPELPIFMLAAARIGAPHVVVYAEYSGSVLASILDETNAEVLVTANGQVRDGTECDMTGEVTQALQETERDIPSVTIDRIDGLDSIDVGYQYEDLRARHDGETVAPTMVDATEPLLICYTSGSTGESIGSKLKTGGYLSYIAWTSHAVLDIEPSDTFWCPAGIEWITGHSYAVYGPLALGATTILYEGAPDYPDRHRTWEIIEDNDVTQFYTNPTAIRSFKEWGESYPASHDLSSLRLLGTVGQRIDPESWWWFFEHVGNEECPIVDTWYQTETGGITLANLPGITDMKPGTVGPALPGISASVVDANGERSAPDEAGYLVFDQPWPGLYSPLDCCVAESATHWEEFGEPGEEWVYFSEDGAVVDEDGYYTILGRLDDVINVGYFSKNRIHVREIEQTIQEDDRVDEVVVVRGDHDIRGKVPYAFIVSPEGDARTIERDVANRIEKHLASAAVPEKTFVVRELPRTFSGGVLRQVLEDLLNGERLGDTDLLCNPEVLDQIAVDIQQYRGAENHV